LAPERIEPETSRKKEYYVSDASPLKIFSEKLFE